MLRLGWAETKILFYVLLAKLLSLAATRGGSCAYPDQSRGLVPRHNMRAISGVGVSPPILLFFIGGGVALHERLVGRARMSWVGFRWRADRLSFPCALQ